MEYRKRQIQRVICKAKTSEFRPSILLTCEDCKTNYLDITKDELAQIQKLLEKDIN